MTNKKKKETKIKELRMMVPEYCAEELAEIQYLSKSRTKGEAFEVALKVSKEVLVKKYVKLHSRPGIVNGTR